MSLLRRLRGTSLLIRFGATSLVLTFVVGAVLSSVLSTAIEDRARQQAEDAALMAVRLGLQPQFTPADLLPFSARDEGYLAFLGRISPEKGPDAAIRIARAAGLPLRMAAKVDAQNAGDPLYQPMSGREAESLAYLAARALVFEGVEQPSGYTEPLLHAFRAEQKAEALEVA